MATDDRYLRDIHGFDPVSWWPPGPGWWLITGIAVVLLAVVAWKRVFIPGRMNVWRRDARRRLLLLRRRARTEQSKQVLGELSELLRRIAMIRRGRRSCAGLSGDLWLEWLTRHDPRGFDWNTNARILLVAPYAQDDFRARKGEVVRLIDAALGWVRTGND